MEFKADCRVLVDGNNVTVVVDTGSVVGIAKALPFNPRVTCTLFSPDRKISERRDLRREEVVAVLQGMDDEYDVDDALRIIQEIKDAGGLGLGFVRNIAAQESLLGGGPGNVGYVFEEMRTPCPEWFVRKYHRQLPGYMQNHPELHYLIEPETEYEAVN